MRRIKELWRGKLQQYNKTKKKAAWRMAARQRKEREWACGEHITVNDRQGERDRSKWELERVAGEIRKWQNEGFSDRGGQEREKWKSRDTKLEVICQSGRKKKLGRWKYGLICPIKPIESTKKHSSRLKILSKNLIKLDSSSTLTLT